MPAIITISCCCCYSMRGTRIDRCAVFDVHKCAENLLRGIELRDRLDVRIELHSALVREHGLLARRCPPVPFPRGERGTRRHQFEDLSLVSELAEIRKALSRSPCFCALPAVDAVGRVRRARDSPRVVTGHGYREPASRGGHCGRRRWLRRRCRCCCWGAFLVAAHLQTICTRGPIDLQKGANFKSVWMVSRMTTSVCFSLCTDLVASGGGAHRRGGTFLE